MKIQFYGQNCFKVSGGKSTVVFDPSDSFEGKGLDFITNSGRFGENCRKLKDVKKILEFPGEFEISKVLAKGFFSRKDNVVYKATIDGISFIHFGTLESALTDDLLKKIGENVDIVFLTLNEEFGVRQAKELIEKLEPRLTLIGGDQSLFPKMIESGARMEGENPITVSRSLLNEERTEILILPV